MKPTLIKWTLTDIKLGKVLQSSIAPLGNKTSKLVGPGVNNHLICRLKKGETVEFDNVHIGIRAKYEPIAKVK